MKGRFFATAEKAAEVGFSDKQCADNFSCAQSWFSMKIYMQESELQFFGSAIS